MPQIIIKCDCKKELRVTDSYVNNQGDIIMVVDSCEKCAAKIPDTYGECNKCEELDALNKELKELKAKNETSH